jgi:hypothetical protein
VVDETDGGEMPLQQDIVERLLVAKDLLSRIRFVPTARPDRVTLARHILTAHDAAELAVAAIARHVGRLPPGPQVYLMDYFPGICLGSGLAISHFKKIEGQIFHSWFFRMVRIEVWTMVGPPF